MICAIVLAAGKSRRMGTQKLLLPVAGGPLIGHVVREVLAGGVEHAFVVVRPDSVLLHEALSPLPVTMVMNHAEDGDMLSSIRCGLRALPAECDRVLIAIGDQPGLSAALVEKLIDAQRTNGKLLAVPFCQGRRGHPVLMSIDLRDELLLRHDGTGLRGLLDNHAADVALVDVEDSESLKDMDLPEEYARVAAPACQRTEAR